MIKRNIALPLLLGILLFTSSCSLLTKALDNRTGFSHYLGQLESSIRSEDWDKAKVNLEDSIKAWKELKPLLQVDIDHDYVNDIEDNFTKLSGYIETNEKSDSLTTVLLIKDSWENIGSL